MKDLNLLLDKTLSGLKDFQLATVESVMQRFNDEAGSGRVLVADEVGLGKTIVAKGVIAELLRAHLNSVGTKKKPLRVTYICSNLTLAHENRRKLAIFKGDDQDEYIQEPSYSRLLEVAVKDKEKRKSTKILELCSLTPSTSFNLTQGHGNWRERLIIYFALIQHKALSQHDKQKEGLSKFFSAEVNNWKSEKKKFEGESKLRKKVLKTFHESLTEKLDSRMQEWCEISFESVSCLDVLIKISLGESDSINATRFRTHIRSLLARASARHLTADLFILDEFQRFKSLLNNQNDDDQSLVAREVFNHDKATKVLLLSATPFKAISQAEDDESGNAHADELNYLLDFISRSDVLSLGEYEENRKGIQRQIFSLRDGSFCLDSLNNENKRAVEGILKNYICRTERSQISKGYESVFNTIDTHGSNFFTTHDVEVFKAIDQLGEVVSKAFNARSSSPVMEFYKSAPWPLSFMSGYQFKKQLDEKRLDTEVKKATKKSKAAWLSRDKIQSYKLRMFDAPHSKTRELITHLFRTPSEELLWVPPSLPHYTLNGSFKGQDNFSKTLLFSSWAMVPKALSGLISYESESRLLFKRRGAKNYYKKKGHKPKIVFAKKQSIAPWSLVYPSKYLMDMKLEFSDVSLDDLIHRKSTAISEALHSLQEHEEGSTQKTKEWYALAPILLDFSSDEGKEYAEQWLEAMSNCEMEDGRRFSFEKLKSALKSGESLQLGPMPDDLAEYLAYLSIASPSVSAARAWKVIWKDVGEKEISMAATEIAFAVISMFNKPQSEAILRKRYKRSSFKSLIRYCADGDFQAVMEEYGHLLRDSGLKFSNAKGQLIDVLRIKTVSVTCQFSEDSTKISSEENNESSSLRCHYAVPLGNQKLSGDEGVQRIDKVRDAFNSPFKPFVLNSTSIGQEGLDFHWYCRSLVHWNLPSNPIDIEQREGRVNRYKSLLVRKRVAEKLKGDVHPYDDAKDPWEQLFQSANELTTNSRESDLIPFWHYPEGTAQIERFVPMMPMSSDTLKLENALKVLSLYRLAFGQPRQEELMKNLLKIKKDFTEEEVKRIKEALIINLSPHMGC